MAALGVATVVLASPVTALADADATPDSGPSSVDDAGDPGADATLPAVAPDADSGTSGWVLTFDDEFDETAVDTCKWQFRYKWGERIINHEEEAYVSAANADQAFTFDNGILHIVARRQPGTYAGRTLPFTSGLLVSLHEQRYGYFEIRSRMPKGYGLWPAFWLLHAVGYPDIHEIDIDEWVSQTPNVAYQTDHFGTNYDTDSRETQVTFTAPDLSDAFHTYAVDWEPDRLVFYVDGMEMGRTTNPGELHDMPMYMVANFAVGGDWPGNPPTIQMFPVSYDIDFIRVYQRVGSEGAPDASVVVPPDFPAPSFTGGACPEGGVDTDGGDGAEGGWADGATPGDSEVGAQGPQLDGATSSVPDGAGPQGDFDGSSPGLQPPTSVRGGCGLAGRAEDHASRYLDGAFTLGAIVLGLARRGRRRRAHGT
jgi:beta-glucanase (GH16 family)